MVFWTWYYCKSDITYKKYHGTNMVFWALYYCMSNAISLKYHGKIVVFWTCYNVKCHITYSTKTLLNAILQKVSQYYHGFGQVFQYHGTFLRITTENCHCTQLIPQH